MTSVVKAKRKSPGSRSKKKGKTKDTRGRIPWGTIITAIIIVAAAAAYIVLRYGGVGRYPEEKRAADAYRKPQSSTLRLYFADSQGEHLVAEQRSVVAASSLEKRIELAVRELLNGPRGSLTHTIQIGRAHV